MATETESTGTKSGLHAKGFIALLVACAMSSGARVGSPPTFGLPGQHETDGPNWFLNQLEHEHAYPEAPSHPYVRTTARAKAYRAFQNARRGDDRRGERSGTPCTPTRARSCARRDETVPPD